MNCQWSKWTIGECSKSCNRGTRTNTRAKIVAESCGGTCSGAPFVTEDCNTNCCPGKYVVISIFRYDYSYYYLIQVNCQWSTWEFGACSKSCNGGNRTNTRTKTNPASCGGSCVGESSLVEDCNTYSCPGI